MTTAALVAATAVVVSGGAHQAGAAPGPTTQTITRTFHYSGVGAAYTVPTGTATAISTTPATSLTQTAWPPPRRCNQPPPARSPSWPA